MGAKQGKVAFTRQLALGSHDRLAARIRADGEATLRRAATHPRLTQAVSARQKLLERGLRRNEEATLELMTALKGVEDLPQAKTAMGPWVAYDNVAQVWDAVARDWSEVGTEAREGCYDRLCSALEGRLPEGGRVVVPGCGTGRLAYDIAERFDARVDGVEPAALMALAARYFLHTATPGMRFHPHLDRAGNNAGSQTRCKDTHAPDVTVDVGAAHRVSIHNVSFAEYVASNPPQADAVVTSFFLDAVEDIVSATEACSALLRPGGVWVNVGPLDYHPTSQIQLSLSELRELIEGDLALVMEECTQIQGLNYSEPRAGATRAEELFNPVFFVASKPMPVK
eukprot:Hpha_TRINITY_DN19920_c0_g1::TRINITY_DN19920_c0_g1_i1::g.93523::m.93523/K19787/CARNMT1; carnosine N-methyltransferase